MKPLRHGYTTGACAAAAAKGSALMLREGRIVREVEIVLPRGERVTFPLHGQRIDGKSASCFVKKDAGDDPDITNGAEIHAAVSLREGEPGVVIEGGTGVGKATKPGLAVAPGEWAINPVPRKMIEDSVREVFPSSQFPVPSPGLTVTISIPDGEERARKTLNSRLGIVGGLSILGTTGIVTPISAKAWTDTIDAAIAVAVACGSPAVVLATGRTSELAAQRFFGNREPGIGTRKGEKAGTEDRKTDAVGALSQRPERTDDEMAENGKCGFYGSRFPVPGSLPEEAFVMMGDHVGHALAACAAQGVKTIFLAAQFAKLVKIACGHPQTHVSSSELDLRNLAEWLEEAGEFVLAEAARRAGTAREVAEAAAFADRLLDLVAERAAAAAKRFTGGLPVNVLLAGYGGEVVYCRRF